LQFKDYDQFHAFWIQCITKINPNFPQQIMVDHFIEAVYIKSAGNEHELLFLSFGNVALLIIEEETSEIKLKFVQRIGDIRYVEQSEQWLTLICEKEVEQINVGDEDLAKGLQAQINNAIKHIS